MYFYFDVLILLFKLLLPLLLFLNVAFWLPILLFIIFPLTTLLFKLKLLLILILIKAGLLLGKIKEFGLSRVLLKLFPSGKIIPLFKWAENKFWYGEIGKGEIIGVYIILGEKVVLFMPKFK